VRKESLIECCAAMCRAFQSGSDNEGYGQLCSDYGNRSFHIGCIDVEIKFCPWCGTPVAPFEEPFDKTIDMTCTECHSDPCKPGCGGGR
jgi:hypothetical protein